MLTETARRLRAAVRESDCAARLGGDEFGVLVVSTADKAGIEAVCRRIAASFSAPVPYGDVMLAVGCSIGAAMYPEDSLTQEGLYKVADLALYAAKRNEPNAFRWSCVHSVEES